MNAISEILHEGSTMASKACIALHGRGGSAKDMLDLANELCNEDYYIIAPQAVNRTWYPQSFMAEEKRNEPYLSASIDSIKDLIDQTAERIPPDQIYLLGFSQGACLSLEISARFATKYGGIIALTGGFFGLTVDEKRYRGNFEGTKVFMSNGDQDPFVPLSRTIQSKEIMERLRAQVTLKVYEGRPHIISEDEVLYVKENILL